MRKPIPEGGPERVVALADGVFAIAITLLVLDLSVPRDLDSAQYEEALYELLPDLGAYALSVVVLGGFWRDHRRIFRTVRQVDGHLISLSLLGLGLAALLPFPTRLVSDYGGEPASPAIYGAAVAALGATHLAMAVLVARRPWLRGDEPKDVGTGRDLLDSAVTVIVFLLTVPLAALIGPGAMLWWLVLIPAKVGISRASRRAR
ncbi:TMEM175 family protein [Streptomyces sp. NPDC052023]|uniref:TMEM175 family protein n=1 Tax=Streptomyces sp. NPDC052023 TaxID=3365681 RepID=UPI0037D568DB